MFSHFWFVRYQQRDILIIIDFGYVGYVCDVITLEVKIGNDENYGFLIKTALFIFLTPNFQDIWINVCVCVCVCVCVSIRSPTCNFQG